MRELFEHTADLGLRAQAQDLNTLLEEMALCLFSAIVEDLSTVRPTQEVSIEIVGSDRDYLLFDWLRELLTRFEIEHMLFSQFQVRVRPDGLTGIARGEELDRERHTLSHEVKAITYHELKVEQSADGWLAEVIVDI